jgi:membrane protein YqaA with SNARE-associated domain
MLHLLLQAKKRSTSQRLFLMLRHLGAAGLFVLAIIDGSPLPTFGGPDILTAVFAAAHSQLWYEYAATATAGSVIGAYLTFRLARQAGSAYLDQKFKKSWLSKFLKIFKRHGTVTLFASAMIPIPTPTSMFFAAAGVSDYPKGKFVAIVAVSRAVRYFTIAFLAAHYGRHFLRVLRHPSQHWGWWAVFGVLTVALIVAGIIMNRRFAAVPAE